jgi:protein SCO1
MTATVKDDKRRRFANVRLRTADGRPVRFYDDLVRDRSVVISFMYTRCNGSCPATTAKLARLQDRFGARMGRDLLFLSITLDPEHDGPAELRKYAATFDAKPGWVFLTGERDDIDALRWSMGIRDLDPAVDRDRSQHGALLTFGNDRTGRWAALPAPSSVPFLASAILRITGVAGG